VQILQKWNVVRFGNLGKIQDIRKKLKKKIRSRTLRERKWVQNQMGYRRQEKSTAPLTRRCNGREAEYQKGQKLVSDVTT